jgi:hypothetical protein
MNQRDEQRNIDQEQALLALLKDYPAPEASADFYDRALVRAANQSARRQRRHWLMTGFGSAAAAAVLLFLIGSQFLSTPQTPDVDANIPGVTIALAEPRTVNLVFSSATALETATLTVNLPDGVELSGFPGQREISWETSLVEGKNLLPLKLIAVGPVGGELLARLVHDDRDRTFRLRVDVS